MVNFSFSCKSFGKRIQGNRFFLMSGEIVVLSAYDDEANEEGINI